MNKIYIFIILVSGCSSKQHDHDHENDHTLQIKQISEGVYMHTSYKEYDSFGWVDSNGLVVVKDKQAIVVDTPWSEAETAELASWISAQGFNLKASVSTHFHEDRTAGIAWLNSQSVTTHTSELTDKILKQNNKARASDVFQGNNLLMLNGLIEVYYPGAGHSQDNLVVWLPDHDLLFGGCLVRSMEWQTLGNTNDANIAQWADSVRNVQAKFPSVKTIVPGHGNLGDSFILDHTIEVAQKAVNSQ